MALAIATVSSNSETPYDGTVVVTKPVGVGTGDLLVIVASTYTEVPAVTCSGFTESLSFGHDVGNVGRDVGFAILYRIADSSDVSASNYSVTGSVFAVNMFRITGYTSGNPIFSSSTLETSSTTSNPGTISSGTINVSVPSEQIIIMGMGSADETYTTYTAPAVTPSSPTFTLLTNYQSENSGGTAFRSSRVAYGIRSQTTNITGFSYTADQDNSSTNSQISFIACICTPINVTGSNALLQTSPETFSPLTGSTQSGSNDYLQTSPNFPEQSGVATAPSVWTPITKS
jgi:hypothetical protein